MHFSKENELRSRVFSEKMGLEAGWNCHISLLSEGHVEDVGSKGVTGSHPDLSTSRHSADSLTLHRSSVGDKGGAAAAGQGEATERRSSAPGAVNLDSSQVKFEEHAAAMDTKGMGDVPRGSDTESGREGDKTELATQCTTPLLKANDLELECKDVTMTSDPMLRHAIGDMKEEDELAYMSERGDRMSSVDSFPASSYVTENTDSTTGGLSFSNRVSLTNSLGRQMGHCLLVYTVSISGS